MGFKKALSATEAIGKLKDNDPTFISCDLSNNAASSAACLREPRITCSVLLMLGRSCK